jgi:signal transduction histidine kinase/DNA-binding response OmpR family regulator
MHQGEVRPLPEKLGAIDFLAGGGEMGALVRTLDWNATPLGPPAAWPQALKIAVRIMLTSRQPIWIGWGKDLIYFYNDPYKSTIGGKHVWALGRPAREVWQEIWSDIGPMLATAMQGDRGTYVESQLLIMHRHGYAEETYYTFSYSPIPNDDGTVGGIICANSDDTQRCIGERQLAVLRELAAEPAKARSWRDACRLSAQALAANPRDIPFAMIYMAEPGSRVLSLVGCHGIDAGHPGAPEIVDGTSQAVWPFWEVLRRPDLRIVPDLNTLIPDGFPSGPWSQPPANAAVVPILPTGETGRAGVLVVGLNPFRLPDTAYRGFLALVAGQIASAVANAQAYEEERRRSEALAELDRAKTAFFSNVSHEFRTPLTLMLGPIEESLARAEQLLPDELERVRTVHRNGLRLLKLVNSLLDFSRIEAGRARASYEAVDLAALTAELASSFRSVIERAGLRFRVDCASLPQAVHVDRDMWEKVVLNLLSNAFKFTFEGEIAVEVRVAAGTASAEVVVRDTGTGIPADELPHLFERFRRVEGAKGRSFEGTGIGLALVQELVKLHGGEIRAASTPGAGSAFTVRIPFGTAHLPPDRISAGSGAGAPASTRAQAFVEEAKLWLRHSAGEIDERPPSASAEALAEVDAVPRAGNQLVFLADDNADMRDYIDRLLRSAGYRVEAFSDGEQLLHRCARVIPHLILSDVMMPKLDGFGLLSALRADQRLRDIPVLLLSARAGEDAKVEGLKSGADDYLIKPFFARELLARVEANLKLAQLRRDGEKAIREEAQLLEELNRVGNTVAAEINLERAVQVVTDAATTLSRAAFGAFFYNVINDRGESYTLYTLSGAPREAFSKFPQPRNTEVFAPTFRGEAIIRSADITEDPRYGRNAPHRGHPPGHLPVRSYLAVPVVSHSGEVLGGLFFGHPEVGVFDERAERLVVGIATQAAIAIDKARLFQAAQSEIERRKHIEAALREDEQLLEAKVEQRTAELLAANDRLRREAIERQRVEAQLRQAQKMEAIGQLTGGVAHDFNNLLTIVIGNIDSIQRNLDGETSTRTKRWIDNAMHGARRAASLTQHLLAFSRRQPLAPRPLDLNKLISNLFQILARTLGEKIEIKTVFSAGAWPVEVDPNQLETAILNLAVNARDAMPNGGRLMIETANAHLDEAYVVGASDVVAGEYVVIAVSDTGYGMAKETLEHAFEPFFTTKPTGHGTGLGLSQVYGFVKQSGGHVRLLSEAGKGTTVKVYLPRFLGEPIEDVVAGDIVPDLSGKETVLVVEDDPNVREYTAELLRDLGYRVVEAENGPSALRHVEHNDPVDLLFTDIGLPGMNGRELADEVRRRRPDTKVLYATGYARNTVVHHGRLDPGVQLIAKPFTYAELASKIRSVLDQA